MKHIACLGALALVACGSNPSVIPAGDFSGPTGLAVAPLTDRDLLFIANQGSNELRAFILCTAPDGPSNPCSSKEDQRFLPAPVRLFPGSIVQVGQRPLRLAGAPLIAADNTPHGAVLVVGSDASLRVVDAASVFAASRDRSVQSAPPIPVQLPELPVDVVATDVPGSTVTAVVATQAGIGVSAALTLFSVGLDADGFVQKPTATQQCAIDFVPTRLALVPGAGGLLSATDRRPRFVYVADGTPDGTPGGIGDGAVEVSVAEIPAVPVTPSAVIPPCPVTRRLPASDPADSPRRARALRSLALSPAYVDESNVPVAAGALLIGATAEDKALCADHETQAACPANLGIPAGAICADHGTRSCGRGRLVLLSTNVGGQSQLLRAPPLTDPAAPMVPLSPRSPAREVAFIARASCLPAAPSDCTALRLLSATSTVVHPRIIGLASTEDGTTNFIDVATRRFFNDARDTNQPTPLPERISTTLTPGPPPGVPAPSIDFPLPASGASRQLPGWLNAGVTRSAQWRVVWHGVMPGLESLSGNLSRTAGAPTVSLRLPPGKSLAPWTSAPELQLGAPPPCTLHSPDCVGDFVRFLSYSRNCGGLANVLANTDVPISAIDGDGRGLQLLAVPGFDPAPDCFASNDFGGTVEVHAGATTAGPWMVFEGLDVLARMPHGLRFVVTGSRFDYPVIPLVSPDINPPPLPPPARDIVVSFTVSGAEPTIAGTFFAFSVDDHQAITGIRDGSTAGVPGFAGPMVVYTSARRPDPVVFTALTGSNSMLIAVPSQFGLANSAFFIY